MMWHSFGKQSGGVQCAQTSTVSNPWGSTQEKSGPRPPGDRDIKPPPCPSAVEQNKEMVGMESVMGGCTAATSCSTQGCVPGTVLGRQSRPAGGLYDPTYRRLHNLGGWSSEQWSPRGWGPGVDKGARQPGWSVALGGGYMGADICKGSLRSTP